MAKKLLKHKGGFKREDKSHKLDFTLIPIPVLKRLAKHYTEGAKAHGKNNWMKSKDLQTFKESAYRHMIQWQNNETDEDHMASCVWNLFCYEFLDKHK